MSYASPLYLFAFLPLIFLLHFLVPQKRRWMVLLAASLLFYFYASRFLFLVLLVTSLIVYGTGLCLGHIQASFEQVKPALDKPARKALKQSIQWQKKFVLASAILLCLLCLLLFKYAAFFIGQIGSLSKLLRLKLHLPALKLLMPLGISFYTLQAIGYLTDVYRGKYQAEPHFGRILLFLCFFPTITEGPISRYDQLGPQLCAGRRPSYDDVMRGITLILWGMFQKIVIADRAAIFVKTVFDDAAGASGLLLIAAVLLYTLQLYADFSGCINIAAGSARLLGIELAPNFRQPFFAHSVSEFWRRWHISLGTWFKDYVFYPVSLSPRFLRFSARMQKHLNHFLGSLFPAAAALLVVWLGTGLWHGSSWKYVAYGFYYFLLIFLGMLFEPLFQAASDRLHISRSAPVLRALQVLRTFLLVNIGMLLFRSASLQEFFHLLPAMFRHLSLSAIWDGTLLAQGLDGMDFGVLAIGALCMLLVGCRKEAGHSPLDTIACGRIPVRWAAFLALFMGVVIFGAYGAAYAPVDFIYAQF